MLFYFFIFLLCASFLGSAPSHMLRQPSVHTWKLLKLPTHTEGKFTPGHSKPTYENIFVTQPVIFFPLLLLFSPLFPESLYLRRNALLPAQQGKWRRRWQVTVIPLKTLIGSFYLRFSHSQLAMLEPFSCLYVWKFCERKLGLFLWARCSDRRALTYLTHLPLILKLLEMFFKCMFLSNAS